MRNFLPKFKGWPTSSLRCSLRTLVILHSALAKKAGSTRVEIGRSHRAIARLKDGTYFWFWIRSHEAYNKLLKRVK